MAEQPAQPRFTCFQSRGPSFRLSPSSDTEEGDDLLLKPPLPRLEGLPVEILNNIILYIDRGNDLLNFVTSHSSFASLVSLRLVDERGAGVAVTLANWYKWNKRSLPGPLLRRAMQDFGHDDAVCAGVVTALLRLKVDPTEYDNDAVVYASQRNLLKTLTILLDDPRVDPCGDNAALQWAYSAGHFEAATLLLEHGADPTTGHGEMLFDAVVADAVDFVRLLLKDSRVNASPRNSKALRGAVLLNNAEMVKLLLSADGVDPAANDNFAIRKAARAGYVDIVRLLLQHPRVDPSTMDNAAICHACKRGNWEVVAVLLADCRVDPTARNYALIEYACRHRHWDTVCLLTSDPRVDLAHPVVQEALEALATLSLDDNINDEEYLSATPLERDGHLEGAEENDGVKSYDPKEADHPMEPTGTCSPPLRNEPSRTRRPLRITPTSNIARMPEEAKKFFSGERIVYTDTAPVPTCGTITTTLNYNDYDDFITSNGESAITEASFGSRGAEVTVANYSEGDFETKLLAPKSTSQTMEVASVASRCIVAAMASYDGDDSDIAFVTSDGTPATMETDSIDKCGAVATATNYDEDEFEITFVTSNSSPPTVTIAESLAISSGVRCHKQVEDANDRKFYKESLAGMRDIIKQQLTGRSVTTAAPYDADDFEITFVTSDCTPDTTKACSVASLGATSTAANYEEGNFEITFITSAEPRAVTSVGLLEADCHKQPCLASSSTPEPASVARRDLVSSTASYDADDMEITFVTSNGIPAVATAAKYDDDDVTIPFVTSRTPRNGASACSGGTSSGARCRTQQSAASSAPLMASYVAARQKVRRVNRSSHSRSGFDQTSARCESQLAAAAAGRDSSFCEIRIASSLGPAVPFRRTTSSKLSEKTFVKREGTATSFPRRTACAVLPSTAPAPESLSVVFADNGNPDLQVPFALRADAAVFTPAKNLPLRQAGQPLGSVLRADAPEFAPGKQNFFDVRRLQSLDQSGSLCRTGCV